MKKYILFFLLITVTGFAQGQDIFESLQYPYEVRHVKLENGESMAYVDEGQGAVVVMVHGLGSYLPAWKKNIEDLKSDFRCIAVDLIGYGKSSKPEETFTLTEQSAMIAELLEKLDISHYHIMGHSMGGQIGIHHALQYKDRVDKLVLIAPAGIETFTDMQRNIFRGMQPEFIMVSDAAAIETNFKANFHDFPQQAEFMIHDRIQMKEDPQFKQYAGAVVAGIHGMVDELVYEKLEELDLPTLVLFGTEDNLIPNRTFNPDLSTEDVWRRAKEKIPNSQGALIPGAGHMLMFEKPQEVNRHLLKFLKNK